SQQAPVSPKRRGLAESAQPVSVSLLMVLTRILPPEFGSFFGRPRRRVSYWPAGTTDGSSPWCSPRALPRLRRESRRGRQQLHRQTAARSVCPDGVPAPGRESRSPPTGDPRGYDAPHL